MQFAIAGVLGVVLTIVAHRWRLARATPPPQPSLDLGQAVRVRAWNPDGTARVAYRGADWDAELVSARHPARRDHVHRCDPRQHARAVRAKTRAVSAAVPRGHVND